MKNSGLVLLMFVSIQLFSQENDCFGITPGKELEIYENAQVGDTIGIVQYYSKGE